MARRSSCERWPWWFTSFGKVGAGLHQLRIIDDDSQRVRRFWRASIDFTDDMHENFFVAKRCDSESLRHAFCQPRRVAPDEDAILSAETRTLKPTAAQPFLAILTFEGAEISSLVRELAPLRCFVAGACGLRVLALQRQHFLKQGAVFFDVLVYSESSAFRFPSARSG